MKITLLIAEKVVSLISVAPYDAHNDQLSVVRGGIPKIARYDMLFHKRRTIWFFSVLNCNTPKHSDKHLKILGTSTLTQHNN